MVIGAVAATWVSVTTALEFKNADGEAFLKIQEKIDGVYPGLLTAAFITLCWWLMAKKKVSPNKVMLLLVIIAFSWGSSWNLLTQVSNTKRKLETVYCNRSIENEVRDLLYEYFILNFY